jgi:uncharacterized protein YndB with AHSA1/START domain
MLAGNGVAAVLVALEGVLVHFFPASAVAVGLPSLLFVPFCVGLTAAWIWRPLELRIGAVLLHSMSCLFLGLFTAAEIFREGVICLIIISPILYGGMLAGALTGRLWFRKNRDRVNLCLAPVLVLAIAAEPALRAPHTSLVTDQISIAAPPARVWPHVLAFKRIPDPPRYWLFRIGLPYPMETKNDGDFVGAHRSCQFSGGAAFEEKIAEIEPTRRLTFDIVEMPADPELLGHLDAHRGQFELHDNGDGTTTLIGRTWYSLHVRPAWYFDWWTHEIFGAVHMRVMRNIKRLAEFQP